MKKIMTVSAIILSMSSTSVMAELSDSLYISAGAGKTQWPDSVFRGNQAWQFAGGYQFTPNIAIELGYADFGEGALEDNGFAYRRGLSGIEANVVGIWPLSTTCSVYGKLGLQHWKSTFSHPQATSTAYIPTKTDTLTGNDPIYTLGAVYNIAPNVGIYAEYRAIKAQAVYKQDAWNFENFEQPVLVHQRQYGDVKTRVFNVGIKYWL